MQVSFGHPLVSTCPWLSSILYASRCKFFTVWPPKESWHKLIKSQLYMCEIYDFLQLVWTCKPTCESVWPPSASPHASPGLQSCCDLHQLASPFDHSFTTVSIGSVSSCQECWCTRDPPLPHRHSWWLKTEPSVSLAVQQIDLLPLGDQRTQVAALLIRRITRVGFHFPSWKFHT